MSSVHIDDKISTTLKTANTGTHDGTMQDMIATTTQHPSRSASSEDLSDTRDCCSSLQNDFYAAWVDMTDYDPSSWHNEQVSTYCVRVS
jgi:hypothetical protein